MDIVLAVCTDGTQPVIPIVTGPVANRIDMSVQLAALDADGNVVLVKASALRTLLGD
jgi:hypothetical protein